MINRYEKGHDAPTGENLGKALRYFEIGIQLPGYNWLLTSEALEKPVAGPQSVGQQLNLKLDKPLELPNRKVQIIRRKDSIEIIISALSVAR